MTMFLSLSGNLTGSVNSLVGLIPSAISLTISAGRLMDIVDMPQEDYSMDAEVRKFMNAYRSIGIGLNMQHMILSLLKPAEAETWICAGNDKDNKMVMSPSTRKLFSYVPQGNTMFSGTIAENMRNVKPDATDEEIISALKLADAWEFVEKLPDGIQSMVKE